MIRRVGILMLAAACLGCAGKSYKADHPVVGPPPPRIRGAEQLAEHGQAVESGVRGQSSIVQTTLTDGSGEGPIPMTAVAARVNGQPILVGTVMAEVRGKLAAMEKQVSPQQYRQLQVEYLKKNLPSHIEQAMMVHAVKLKLKDDMLKNVEAQLDDHFNAYVDELQKKMNVNSVAEVEAVLQQQGLTLPVMRKMFGDNQLARQYMQAKMGEPPEVSRQEMLAAYRDRQEEFTEPSQVKWQQVQISFKHFSSPEEARSVATKALAALSRGKTFDEVAAEYSDGPDAAKGGHWDWTQLESVAPELREPLSTMAVGKPSGIIQTASNLQIVQVLERKEARVRPFEELQQQIREELLEAKNDARRQKVLDDLRSTCIVETMFDEPTQISSATPAGTNGSDTSISAFSQEGS